MHPLLRSLSGGDRRSVGESNRAAALVLEHPELIDVLFRGLDSDEAVLRMRCADAIEKATVTRPELLVPYKDALRHRFSKIEQPDVRWHVVALLARLPLSETEAVDTARGLLAFSNDHSRIVRTLTMQALVDIALRHRGLLPEVTGHIRELTVIGTPAMKARGKRLLRALAKASGENPDAPVSRA